MDITEEEFRSMLITAMKKAVAVGLFPKHPVSEDSYLTHWRQMEDVLRVAVNQVKE